MIFEIDFLFETSMLFCGTLALKITGASNIVNDFCTKNVPLIVRAKGVWVASLWFRGY